MVIKTVEDYQRRFSLEDDFMNYSTDDLLYGIMQYLATYHPAWGKLYLTKKNFVKNKKLIRDVCGVSQQTLNNHMKKLIEKGLIQEDMVLMGDDKVEYDCYIFPYNRDENYQLINNEMLWYIVSTRSKQAVRVYIQLLNWYKWKRENNDTFVFTNRDIMKKLGYSTDCKNPNASSVVSNILESFKREGVIDYCEFAEMVIDNKGNEFSISRKRLLFVASSKSELKKV